jgi:hypothetical protein
MAGLTSCRHPVGSRSIACVDGLERQPAKLRVAKRIRLRA